MGAGESLRAAAYKIAQKVAGCDKAVSLWVDLVGPYDPATEARPLPVPTLLVTVGQACDLRNISVERATALLGSYEAGDRELRVPAELVTETMLDQPGVYLTYGTETLDVRRYDPHEIAFGVVLTWRLVCRLRGKGVP